jgi:CelD/BcsL family acetyltransferase involved in cellulose biosynthesis
MRVSVVRPEELGGADAELWAKFQHLSPVTLSPFLSLTFARAVARARPSARVAVVEDDGQIQAFLPFELGPQRIGMPIGYPMNDLQGFIGSGAPVDARQVIRKAGLRGWRFIAVPAAQAALAPHHYEGTAARCPVIDLTGGYQAYYASRSKSVTAEPARKRRALERQHGPVTLAWNTASPGHLRQMISWKSAKYHGSRQLFADPTAGRILAELAATDDPGCHGVLSVLLAGDQPVAINFNLAGHGRLCGWFPAYDPGLSRFSPGMIMAFAIAEQAPSQGVVHYDLGYGQDSYKLGLANHFYPVAGGAVWVSRGEAAARKLYRRLRRPPAAASAVASVSTR